MKEIHDFTARYDLDFFMRKLLGFLVTNKFMLDPDTHQVVQNVIDAENAFYEQRLAGKLVPEALEIAEDTLFQNVIRREIIKTRLKCSETVSHVPEFTRATADAGLNIDNSLSIVDNVASIASSQFLLPSYVI